ANGEFTELHHTLIEESNGRAVSDVLARVWEVARPCGGSRRHELPGEWLRLYHIAHAAKHFVHGGCGIRPTADLFLLDRADPAAAERTELLGESGLSAFASALRDLSAVWWGGEERSPLTADMEEYLLGAGVYGSSKNRIAVVQNRTGKGLGYLWHRLFLPRDVLATSYPVLKKHPILYPWYTVRRWCRGLFLRRRSVRAELAAARSLTVEERVFVEGLLDRLELTK
ncbi:MAG: hypothetical protein J6125_04055, partial [Clostridia bacterium]|nr:hypothetical protein [Clostridia bacterium]